MEPKPIIIKGPMPGEGVELFLRRFGHLPSVEYSQGVCGDGAAILCDGEPMTPDEIVTEFREYGKLKELVVCALRSLPEKPYVAIRLLLYGD